ncbi:MAG: hypothetical protein AAFX54_00355 [Pseudomonadota bacterium]
MTTTPKKRKAFLTPSSRSDEIIAQGRDIDDVVFVIKLHDLARVVWFIRIFRIVFLSMSSPYRKRSSAPG